MSNHKLDHILRTALIPVLLLSVSSASVDKSDYSEVIPGTSLAIDMVWIEEGSFTMGSPASETGRDADEGPQHQVAVDGFWMSSAEVTWDMYEVFLYRNKDDIPHPEPGIVKLDVDGVSGATMPYVNFNKPGYPVVNITQYAASVFCEWLTARTGRFYRLPTEAEWEYACRAGQGDDYRTSLEGVPGEYAWYAQNSNETVNRGRMKEPNPWGLYDMHGNAAEWVLDYYETDAYAQPGREKNPMIMKDELYPHVVRGGSWRDRADQLRCASRQQSVADWKKRDPQFPKSLWWHTDALHVGFRVVRPAEPPPEEDWNKYRIKPINDY